MARWWQKCSGCRKPSLLVLCDECVKRAFDPPVAKSKWKRTPFGRRPKPQPEDSP